MKSPKDFLSLMQTILGLTFAPSKAFSFVAQPPTVPLQATVRPGLHYNFVAHWLNLITNHIDRTLRYSLHVSSAVWCADSPPIVLAYKNRLGDAPYTYIPVEPPKSATSLQTCFDTIVGTIATINNHGCSVREPVLPHNSLGTVRHLCCLQTCAVWNP